MSKIVVLSLCFFILGCNSEVVNSTIDTKKQKPHTPTLKQYTAIWNELLSDSLEVLPQESVSYSKLFDAGVDLISKNAKRTLNIREDILNPFDKLAHPNGVCLSGLWKIDTANPYSGQFRNGSESLVIARASTAMSETKRGETRAFGMAVKLFGTTQKQKVLTGSTANFFVIDDLAGTDAQYYTDVALTNEPEVSFTWTLLGSLAYALKVSSAFSNADKNSGIRQLYELSSLGETQDSAVVTPKWIKIEAAPKQTKFGVKDFRDEFKLAKNEKLIFNISVTSQETDGVKEWQKIGTITYNSSVVSTTCDHRLHFHHPKWRDDLVYE